MHGPARRAGGRGQPGAGGTVAYIPYDQHYRTEGLKWSKRPRCTAGVTLTATNTIASPQADFLFGQWSRAELLSQSSMPACLSACRPAHATPVERKQNLGLSIGPGSGIPSQLQLCQGLHLVILFLSLGWLFTVPKQQKKAASKAKPCQKTQGKAHDTKHRPAPVLLTISPTDTANHQVPFPKSSGEFQREGSPKGSRGRRLLIPEPQPLEELQSSPAFSSMCSGPPFRMHV